MLTLKKLYVNGWDQWEELEARKLKNVKRIIKSYIITQSYLK